MIIWISIKLALRDLLRNKMRTLLTMLGIIIGVGAVITMLAITGGAEKKILEAIKSFGNNTMFIEYNWRYTGSKKSAKSIVLTEKDAKVIQSECKYVVYASPVLNKTLKVVRGNRNHSTRIVAGTENIDFIQGWKVERGRFFTPAEVTSGAKVCVIGTIVEEALFNEGEPVIGQSVRINRIPFKVVGIFQAKGASSGVNDQDDVVYIPHTTMQQRIQKFRRFRLIASASTLEDLPHAKEEVLQLLKQRFKVTDNPEQVFDIRTQEEIITMVKTQTQVFSIFLGVVASISLLVGGIGIMNIMLVTVNERIREIGIRMALGARSRDILRQFLVESITLSIIGGLIGVGFGYAASWIVKTATQWDLYISPFSVILSISFASAVGVFFGFFPAWKASKLDPIQALRHE